MTLGCAAVVNVPAYVLAVILSTVRSPSKSIASACRVVKLAAVAFRVPNVFVVPVNTLLDVRPAAWVFIWLVLTRPVSYTHLTLPTSDLV